MNTAGLESARFENWKVENGWAGKPRQLHPHSKRRCNAQWPPGTESETRLPDRWLTLVHGTKTQYTPQHLNSATGVATPGWPRTYHNTENFPSPRLKCYTKPHYQEKVSLHRGVGHGLAGSVLYSHPLPSKGSSDTSSRNRLMHNVLFFTCFQFLHRQNSGERLKPGKNRTFLIKRLRNPCFWEIWILDPGAAGREAQTIIWQGTKEWEWTGKADKEEPERTRKRGAGKPPVRREQGRKLVQGEQVPRKPCSLPLRTGETTQWAVKFS